MLSKLWSVFKIINIQKLEETLRTVHITFSDFLSDMGHQQEYILSIYGKPSHPMIWVKRDNAEENLMKALIEYHKDDRDVEKYMNNDEVRYALKTYVQAYDKPVNVNLIRNKMQDLEFEEITDMLDEYHVFYDKDMSARGDVDIYNKVIRINTFFLNEEIDTLMHELRHVYDHVLNELSPEYIIEDDAQRYIQDNPGIKHYLNCYLENKLK